MHKEEDEGHTLIFKIAKKHQRPLRRSPTKENLDQESEESEKSEEDKFDDTGDENEISLESDSDEENIGKKMNNYVDTLLELPDETPDIPNDEFEKKKNDIFGASCDLSSLSWSNACSSLRLDFSDLRIELRDWEDVMERPEDIEEVQVEQVLIQSIA